MDPESMLKIADLGLSGVTLVMLVWATGRIASHFKAQSDRSEAHVTAAREVERKYLTDFVGGIQSYVTESRAAERAHVVQVIAAAERISANGTETARHMSTASHANAEMARELDGVLDKLKDMKRDQET